LRFFITLLRSLTALLRSFAAQARPSCLVTVLVG
jgi:hypothetical protein